MTSNYRHSGHITMLRILSLAFVIVFIFSVSKAQTGIIDICPNTGIQQRSANFEPSGMILTAFDSAAIWVYDIGRDTRYPLPETRPCTSNCHLSPDAEWLIYLNPETFIFGKMRVDGTQRMPLVNNASDVRWWNQDTLLVWTTNHEAYLRPEADNTIEPDYLPIAGTLSIQPNGRYALELNSDDNGNFNRYMVNLEDPEQVPVLLAPDRTYFNATAWSPNGQHLVYVGNGAFNEASNITGAEIYLAAPNNAIPQQVTFFSTAYGAVRINGYAPSDLSWSPDSTRLAFWVIELSGNDPAVDTGAAVLHMLDIRTGQMNRYCGYTTTEHTPETPRIVWSPDSTHIAFAGNVAGDDKGALLLAVDVADGTFTELSNGMFPVYGIPQLIAWGNVP